LGGLKKLKICTSYKIGNDITPYFPALVQNAANAVPQYETLEGWEEDISKVRKFEDFPENTIRYIRRIEEICETEVKIASVGPGREETIEIKPLFR
jgi:adenylosuccinate synthase